MESNYTVPRMEGAAMLGISTRTLDRYIRSGRLRSKKIGKNIHLHREDVERLKNGSIQEEVTIVSRPRLPEGEGVEYRAAGPDYRSLYEEVRGEVERKDATIKELAYNLGKLEVELKNSVSLAEHKKTAYLLESSKSRLEDESQRFRTDAQRASSDAAQARSLNTVLVLALVVVSLAVAAVWFFSL